MSSLQKSVNSVMGFAPPEGGFESEAVGPSTASAGSSEDLSVYGMRASPYESMGVHIRPPEHGASDMAAGPSYSSSPLNFSSSRMLNFNVEYRDKNTAVVLPDSETVGQLIVFTYNFTWSTELKTLPHQGGQIWVQSGSDRPPYGTNPGLFQIDLIKVLDLSHLGPI